MNTKNFIKILGLFICAFVLSGCQTVKEANKPFKHNTPLIKENIKKDGKAEENKYLLKPKEIIY